jgi:hypothetical protein
MRHDPFALLFALVTLPAHAEVQKMPAACNAFAWSVCFSIDNGDVLTQKPIIDFTIHEVDIARGAHVTIYEGIGLAEQDGVGTVTTERSYETASGKVEVKIGSKATPQYFDLHYNPAKGWGVVQVFGYLKDGKQAGVAADFLTGIHPCKHENLSLICTADAPFAEGASFIRGLVK